MKFQHKDQWQHYLLQHLNGSHGGYAVASYNGKTQLLYFAKHHHEGTPWLLEAPNELRRFPLEKDEDVTPWLERGYLIKDHYAYDIDSPQCAPFLPDEIEVLEVIGSSEGKALDYLLKYDYKDAKWKN